MKLTQILLSKKEVEEKIQNFEIGEIKTVKTYFVTQPLWKKILKHMK